MRTHKIIMLLIISLLLVTSGCMNKRKLAAKKMYDAGEYYRAAEKYKKLQGKKKISKKEQAEFFYIIGRCYHHMNQTKEAARWYKKSITRKYDKPDVRLYYADVQRINNKLEDALKYYDEYKNLVPDDPRGTNGIEACGKITEWQDIPSSYRVENMKVFNSRESDFSPSYAKADYSVIYFTSTREAAKGNKINPNSGMFFADIFSSRQDRTGEWSTPSPVNDSINSPDDEGSCTFNTKFSTLYFTRCFELKENKVVRKIFKAKRSGGSWEPAEMVEIKALSDSLINLGHPTLSEDELTMIFNADLTDTSGIAGINKYSEMSLGGSDLWMVQRKTKTYPWGEPVNLGYEINTEGNEGFPYIYNDTTLYFSSDYHVGMGGLDIFKATKGENGIWKVENMKHPINSTGDDFGIIINKEDGSGFFTSSRFEGSRGGDDIYRFSLPDLKFTMVGKVIDEKTEKPLKDVKVNMMGSNGTSHEKITEADGAFNFELRKGTDYLIRTERVQYFRAKTNETTKGLKESKELRVEIVMVPIPDKETAVEIPNIEYDLNSWQLRAEAMFALDKLVNLLIENPNIAIELGSNTDYRGSTVANDTLSLRRAQSVISYLMKRRIEPERLLARGYGEQQPKVVDSLLNVRYPYLPVNAVLDENFIINSLENTAQREIAHQMNRRTEFRVLTTEYRPGMKLEEEIKEDDDNK